MKPTTIFPKEISPLLLFSLFQFSYVNADDGSFALAIAPVENFMETYFPNFLIVGIGIALVTKLCQIILSDHQLFAPNQAGESTSSVPDVAQQLELVDLSKSTANDVAIDHSVQPVNCILDQAPPAIKRKIIID